MGLNTLYTPKQIEILKRTSQSDWFMLINHGAKRSGKTILNNDLFLNELISVRKTADRLKIEKPQYILAGATLSTINQNILTELTNKYGTEFKFDKYNNFTMFGVYVIQTGHETIGGLSKIRGMTAHGAYINEASLANEAVFDEIKSRCSGEGARVVCDTNPDNPEHWLLKDYIMNPDPQILSYQFTLDDNTFLSERYKTNIKNSTPSGMFYDRNINGEWVTGKGCIYIDFDKDKHYVNMPSLDRFRRFFAGVDWGYSHYGSIVVVGETWTGEYYLVKEVAEQFQEIGFWVEAAKEIQRQFGDINFYCDSARPEHVARFINEGISAYNANKKVISGIETLSRLYKENKLFIIEHGVKRFKEEIYMYTWNEKTGEPLKVFDDVQDSLRYAIYSDVNFEESDAYETTNAISSLGL